MLAGRMFAVCVGGRLGDPAETGLDPLARMFVVFRTNGDSCGVDANTAKASAGGTTKNEMGAAGGAGVFFLESFGPGESGEGALTPAFCRLALTAATEAVATDGPLPFTESVERYNAHRAEKLPEFLAMELGPADKAEGETGPTLANADSMAVFTVRFRGSERTHSTWMHLMRQPVAIERDEQDGEEEEWNQVNPKDADGTR